MKIILNAVPTVKFIKGKYNNLPSLTYDIGRIYRGANKFKIVASAGLQDGLQFFVCGSDKPTGFEPFCSKWADRIKEAPLHWGFHGVNGLVLNDVHDYFAQWSAELIMDKSNNPIPHTYDHQSLRTKARLSLIRKGLLPKE